MSRKIKPNRLFEDTNDVDISAIAEDVNAIVEETPAKELGADENPMLGTGRISVEDINKLQQYDAMQKSLTEISEEKSQLEAKVVEYIEQIESLKNSSNEIKKMQDEIDSLKDKCKALEESNANANAIAQENATLKEENEQYLMKISDLTFENANLACQLSELEKKVKQTGNMPNQNSFAPVKGVQQQMYRSLAKPNRDVYNPYANNGYGTW